MYNIDSLVKLNYSYHTEHKITQADVDMANMRVRIIEESRTDHTIQVGDIVEYTTAHGDFYRNGHFQSYEEADDQWYICEQPYVPFISLTTSMDNITCDTSGGAWADIPSKLKLIGKRKKKFKDWGHKGVCGNGSITFEALVNVWEYKEPNPLYGEYTTREYDRQYIHYRLDLLSLKRGSRQYRYYGQDISFATKTEYEIWRDTFRGVELAGHHEAQTVVFTYKRIEKLITKAEYNQLVLPVDTRTCNGTIEVKVCYDDSAKTVTEYRYTNDGCKLWDEKPYRLMRQSRMQLHDLC